MKKSDWIFTALLAAVCCLAAAMLSIFTGDIGVKLEGEVNCNGGAVVNVSPGVIIDEVLPVDTQKTATATSVDSTEKSDKPLDTTPDENAPLKSTQEIIDKYTFLVDKFKKEKPAYKKKEYQALPEEYRNFSSAVNSVLGLAANYMVSEEDCEELLRDKGSEDILNDMPIHGSEKGCALTDYDAVDWAKCEDLGDGTYKISFSLKEEYNAEPTPADTLVPVSAHGAVMQPMAISDIKTELDSVVSKLPGITLNGFDLIYRDCVFSCVYDSSTDQVKSITHNIAIDITADVKAFSANINGSARLTDDMFIYDIQW